jgi:hypothetical protein
VSEQTIPKSTMPEGYNREPLSAVRARVRVAEKRGDLDGKGRMRYWHTESGTPVARWAYPVDIVEVVDAGRGAWTEEAARELLDRLRREADEDDDGGGRSKQPAAPTSDAPPEDIAYGEEELAAMDRTELLNLAALHGVKGVRSMKNDEIVREILKAQDAAAEA